MKKLIGKLVVFKRPADHEDLYGFVLDYNNDLTLIQVVHNDMFLNGYMVFRNETVSAYKDNTKKNDFMLKALKIQKLKTSRPININLEDIVTSLIDLNKKFPLLVFHREYINNSVCHIGSIETITNKIVEIRTIDPFAKYSGKIKFKLKDITKVSCGGNYEKCLWLLAGKKTKKILEANMKI